MKNKNGPFPFGNEPSLFFFLKKIPITELVLLLQQELQPEFLLL